MTTSKNTATEWKALEPRIRQILIETCRGEINAATAAISEVVQSASSELLEEVERLKRERDEARAESALAIDMHRELASWADHRHSLSDEGHLAIQKRARDAEAQVERLRGALEPFAKVAEFEDGRGRWTPGTFWSAPMEDFRRARAALSESQNP